MVCYSTVGGRTVGVLIVSSYNTAQYCRAGAIEKKDVVNSGVRGVQNKSEVQSRSRIEVDSTSELSCYFTYQSTA
jgi:hypothetical protein